MADAPGPTIFFGTPSFAVPTLEALVETRFRPSLVVSQPSRPVGRGRRIVPPPIAVRAGELELACHQVESVRDPGFLELVSALEPWAAVVIAFGQIFPKSLLEIPAEGCINVHASLLPKYRGAAPIQAALAAGDEITGVTTMRMNRGLDTGPILLEREVNIGPDDLAPDLAGRLAEVGAKLLVETLEGLAQGVVVATPQEDEEATFAPRLEKSSGTIDWDRDAASIYNMYRAYQPWPGAYSKFRRQPLKVTACRPGQPVDAESKTGTIVAVGPTLGVACGGGSSLILDSVQRPGRRVLPAADFVNGERVTVGERFDRS